MTPEPALPCPMPTVLEFAPLPAPRYRGKLLPFVVAALGYAGDRRWIALYESPAGLAIEDGRQVLLLEPTASPEESALDRFNLLRDGFPFAEGFRGHRLGDGETNPEFLDFVLVDRCTGDVWVLPAEDARHALHHRAHEALPAEFCDDTVVEFFHTWLDGQGRLIFAEGEEWADWMSRGG